MKALTKKEYIKRINTGYYPIEPHFWYYCQIKMFRYFKTIIKNNISTKDFQSAMYGEFVSEGKPISDGFLDNFNLIRNLCEESIKRSQTQSTTNNNQQTKPPIKVGSS